MSKHFIRQAVRNLLRVPLIVSRSLVPSPPLFFQTTIASTSRNNLDAVRFGWTSRAHRGFEMGSGVWGTLNISEIKT